MEKWKEKNGAGGGAIGVMPCDATVSHSEESELHPKDNEKLWRFMIGMWQDQVFILGSLCANNIPAQVLLSMLSL